MRLIVWRVAIVATFVIPLLLVAPNSRAEAASPSDAYAGWAMEAYPNMTTADFVAAFTRMRNAGANLVWLGQSNPVSVNPNNTEVGLSYEAYAAGTNPTDPKYANAQAILAAQRRALDAARTVGIKVVLPVGYQTQMGSEWNALHPASLRRGPNGTILNYGGEDASPYAGAFRTDMSKYYQWVDQNFVAPYRDVILMINLSDEPTGVDYSDAANSVFFQKYGYHFADVGNNPQRVTQLGYFQSHVMVDFATWAAQQWLAIDPAMTVTLSFDGEPGRKSEQAPALEAIFREAPPNFQPAWDAYPRDGTPANALNDSDLTQLSVLLGTLGHFSAEYHRPYWLWSTGNSWGLGQASSDPSNIADALVNLHMLADVSRQAGGLLRGIAVWNYNVRGQGLYNNPGHTVYNPDDLFSRVTAALPGIRQIIRGPSGPGIDAVVLAPNSMPDQMIGASRLTDIFSFRGYNFGDLISLARSGATIGVVGSLAGEDLSHTRLLVVLARGPSALSPVDVSAIRAYLANGGTVVDAQNVDSALNFHAQWIYPGNAPEAFFAKPYTNSNVGPVAALGLPRLTNSFIVRGPEELVAYGGTSFAPSSQMRAWAQLPAGLTAENFDSSGVQTGTTKLASGLVGIPTQRHAFSLVSLDTALPVIATTGRYFPQTGFLVDNDTIWNYFVHRGGIQTFGYPTSRTFQFLGYPTQFFQRAVVQIGPNGQARLLNLLDPGFLPYQSFNFAVFPGLDPALVAAAPAPGSPNYASQILAFVRNAAPDSWNGHPVGFYQTFSHAVSASDISSTGTVDAGLLPGFDLEVWGVPTSKPMVDPNNHNFVYQRFQRGIMMYDATCGCTQGVLLADYLKGILTGTGLPSDVSLEAQQSRFYRQYDPNSPNWVRNPQLLPGTNLTNAFTTE